MFIFLIIIHIIVCLILILTILLQAGKGGGLTEAFGGGENMQSVLGAQAPTLLKKATEVSAIVFLITSLLLGMVTARRSRSLFERSVMPGETGMPARQDVMPVAPSSEAIPAGGVAVPIAPVSSDMPEVDETGTEAAEGIQ